MNLDQLIAAGSIIPNSLVKKTVTWKHRNANNKTVTDTFNVLVKKEMSAADFEFIHTKRGDGEEALMARRVSRMVLLGDDGSEQIPLAAATNFQLGLLWALIAAINEVEKENYPEDKENPKDQAPKN